MRKTSSTPLQTPTYLSLLLVLLSSLLTTQACKSEPKIDVKTLKVPPSTSASIARGKKLFSSLCVSCHGKEGKGDGPGARALYIKPTNLAAGAYRHGKTPGHLFKVITEGSPTTPLMAPWRHLPEKDRWALTHFVSSLPKKPSQPSNKPK
tara:strand:+ start:5550 stop:5999 length:450 start_codon:yes stop_codon:yes gene_type:complete